jgi:hypothetical protein
MGAVDAIIAQAQGEIGRLARLVVGAQITPTRWYREMKIVLLRQWTGSYMAGTGRDGLSPAEHKWLTQEYNRHNTHLQSFRDAIKAGELSEAQIAARADMYSRRLRGLYNSGRVAAHDIKLPQVPGDGQTRCTTNCKCRLEFLDVRDDSGMITAVQVRWVMNAAAENCEDCVRLSQDPSWQPKVVYVT